MVEAVVEDVDVRVQTFKQLDEPLGDEALIASNTSSIPIAGLASATAWPDRVLGSAFFSPVSVMKLVEVVVGIETSDATVAKAELRRPDRQ